MTEPYVGIITFGFGHEDPQTGENLGSCFVRVPALDREDARVRMNASRFGQTWAFQYDNPEEAGVERWNLREVPLELEEVDT